jgi:hypothetical protein
MNTSVANTSVNETIGLASGLGAGSASFSAGVGATLGDGSRVSVVTMDNEQHVTLLMLQDERDRLKAMVHDSQSRFEALDQERRRVVEYMAKADHSEQQSRREIEELRRVNEQLLASAGGTQPTSSVQPPVPPGGSVAGAIEYPPSLSGTSTAGAARERERLEVAQRREQQRLGEQLRQLQRLQRVQRLLVDGEDPSASTGTDASELIQDALFDAEADDSSLAAVEGEGVEEEQLRLVVVKLEGSARRLRKQAAEAEQGLLAKEAKEATLKAENERLVMRLREVRKPHIHPPKLIIPRPTHVTISTHTYDCYLPIPTPVYPLPSRFPCPTSSPSFSRSKPWMQVRASRRCSTPPQVRPSRTCRQPIFVCISTRRRDGCNV